MENGAQTGREERGLTSIISTVERFVLFTALGLAAFAGLFWGTFHAVGSVACGGLLAFVNLLVMRRMIGGMLQGTNTKRAAMSVALVLKMGLLLAAIWASISILGLDAIGVGLGLSALVVGIVAGTLFVSPQHNTDRIRTGQ